MAPVALAPAFATVDSCSPRVLSRATSRSRSRFGQWRQNPCCPRSCRYPFQTVASLLPGGAVVARHVSCIPGHDVLLVLDPFVATSRSRCQTWCYPRSSFSPSGRVAVTSRSRFPSRGHPRSCQRLLARSSIAAISRWRCRCSSCLVCPRSWSSPLPVVVATSRSRSRVLAHPKSSCVLSVCAGMAYFQVALSRLSTPTTSIASQVMSHFSFVSAAGQSATLLLICHDSLRLPHEAAWHDLLHDFARIPGHAHPFFSTASGGQSHFRMF